MRGEYIFPRKSGRNSSRNSINCQPTGTKGWPGFGKDSRNDIISQEYIEQSRKLLVNIIYIYGTRFYTMPCIG
jgi:hypothetical protein